MCRAADITGDETVTLDGVGQARRGAGQVTWEREVNWRKWVKGGRSWAMAPRLRAPRRAHVGVRGSRRDTHAPT